MIHRNNSVVVATKRIVEESVRGDGAFDVQSAGAGAFDGRSDGGDFFGAHFATFAGVRIQAANSYAGAAEAKISAGLRSQLDGLLDFRTSDPIRHRSKGQMGGHKSDPEPAIPVVG